MYPSVIRSAMHAATRCALAITALLLGINLRNITFEEENKRGLLQWRILKNRSTWLWEFVGRVEVVTSKI